MELSPAARCRPRWRRHLDEGRWRSYAKLQRELAHLARRDDPGEQARVRKVWIQRSKNIARNEAPGGGRGLTQRVGRSDAYWSDGRRRARRQTVSTNNREAHVQASAEENQSDGHLFLEREVPVGAMASCVEFIVGGQ